ncbi:MAG TPA: hypothetical protein VNJ08_01765 [Bacteriovoracaceae bacterium]|nr:hypothetical protein [Bacteriovoracaceae bacterium]
MLKSVSLLLITLLITLSAHSGLNSSIPDFSKTITDTLAPVEADSGWTASVPGKNNSLEVHEKLVRASFDFNATLVTFPDRRPFEKKFFDQQLLAYHSYYTRPFELII